MKDCSRAKMVKIRGRTAAAKVRGKPAWIGDTANQKQWNDRFIAILKRDYKSSDSTVAAILGNERLAQKCATRVRSYVDKRATAWLYAQRKARGAARTRQLKIALAGLNAAIDFYTERGNQANANYLGGLTKDLSEVFERCKAAYATKRHGRDRAHSTLSECHFFLESELRRPVTYATLANLVNGGFEADGNAFGEPITEEHLRKNLTAFRRSNPSWRNDIGPRFRPRLTDPATK
jgi:hypothetical protein